MADARRNHKGYRVGQDHQHAKVPDALVRQIREEHERSQQRAGNGGGGGYATLARKHGIGVSTVRDFVTYRTRASA